MLCTLITNIVILKVELSKRLLNREVVYENNEELIKNLPYYGIIHRSNIEYLHLSYCYCEYRDVPTPVRTREKNWHLKG